MNSALVPKLNAFLPAFEDKIRVKISWWKNESLLSLSHETTAFVLKSLVLFDRFFQRFAFSDTSDENLYFQHFYYSRAKRGDLEWTHTLQEIDSRLANQLGGKYKRIKYVQILTVKGYLPLRTMSERSSRAMPTCQCPIKSVCMRAGHAWQIATISHCSFP